MPLKTKEEARANFEASTTYIPARYEAGVMKAEWQTKAASDQAEKNYASAVSKAISSKSRQSAIKKVSNSEWQTAAVTKGAPIIGERIKGALDKWAANWGPMYDAVAGRVGTLPSRTTDWRSNINSRLVPVVEAWKKAAGKA